jgi:hypothetical protein
MTTKHVKNLLNPSNANDLGDILRRAREMGELTEKLVRALPGRHSAGIVAANLREDDTLVVLVVSSAWASRLRYEADVLLEAARTAGIDAQSCRIRVSRG